MNFNELFGLRENPFRMTPSAHSEDIVWAGFSELKQKIERRIAMSMRLSNPSLVMNWGAYGSGKTHAANYFTQEHILVELAEKNNVPSRPFALKITLPKGKNPIEDVFITIIDRLDLEELRQQFEECNNLEGYIENISDNMIIRNVLKGMFTNSNIPSNTMKSYLYGTLSKSDLKRDFEATGILRMLNIGDNDAIQLLAGIFSCLTYEQRIYSSVVLWLDEFEDIQTMTNANIDKTNNFVRELLDETPNHFLIFINFTLSALAGIEDLGSYLSAAVVDRVKTRIEFTEPNKDILLSYFRELISKFRTRTIEDDYAPFTTDSLDYIISELGTTSLRSYNEAFSILLELAAFDETNEINRIYTAQNRDEWKGWK